MMTLTGTLADHAGNPLAKATLIITPTPAVTIDAAGKVIHLGGVEVTTDETGAFTVDLATAPGLWYTVRSTPSGRLRPVRFPAETDGATTDLADAHPVPAPSPMAEYVRGASAYQVAVAAGYQGTETEWLASLRGDSGAATTDHDVLIITTGA